jgi:DNA-binding transcriptional ArsR family regulator
MTAPAGTDAQGAAGRVFAALGDPVRRHLLRLVHGAGEAGAGDLVAAVQEVTPISQPAVSQHLRVLREAGLVRVRAEGTRRVYSLDDAGLDVARDWLAAFADPFAQPLDALATELARGRRERRRAADATRDAVSGSPATGSSPADGARRGARRAG